MSKDASSDFKGESHHCLTPDREDSSYTRVLTPGPLFLAHSPRIQKDDTRTYQEALSFDSMQPYREDAKATNSLRLVTTSKQESGSHAGIAELVFGMSSRPSENHTMKAVTCVRQNHKVSLGIFLLNQTSKSFDCLNSM